MGVGSWLAHAWNAFTSPDTDHRPAPRGLDYGISYGGRPDRVRFNFSNERSIISSIYTRIAIDVASVDIRHIRMDEQKRYVEDIESGLNNCLSVEANIDQGASEFIMDVVSQMCDEGVIAIAPIDTSLNPNETGGYDIQSWRVGRVVAWHPRHVRINLYNDITGRREEVVMDKRNVAIVTNPLYSVMNEPNSTLQRLIRKLNLLDAVDEQSASGKLDLIIQLPYVVKTDTKRQQADQRRKDIEMQLKGSQYGIAYTDGTEKITQLNRPAENNLMGQVEFLTQMLYSQLGLTKEIMDGTADEAAMLNYINRTIEPILRAVAEELTRKFLTKTARTQRQTVAYFRDPFKLVPMANLAELADKFTRNEIVSSNEFRGFMGMKPSKDPKADKLINSNMPQAADPAALPAGPSADTAEDDDITNSALDEVDRAIDGVFSDLGVDLDADTG